MSEPTHTKKEMILDTEIAKDMDKHLKKLETEKENRALQERKAPSAWKLSEVGRSAVSRGVALFQTDFGLYAAIPMLCKGEECAYATLFPDLHSGHTEEDERCPVEVAFIMTKYDQYVKELDIQPSDAVDMSILRDLIDYDVQILRADNKMVLEGDFLKEQVVSIDDTGKPIFKEDISPTANYKDKIQVRRNKTLEMLNSTRKDKAGTKITAVMDPSSYAKELLMRTVQNDSADTVEGLFEELDIVEDVPYMQKYREEQDAIEAKKTAYSQPHLSGDGDE